MIRLDPDGRGVPVREEDVRRGPPDMDYARPFPEKAIKKGRHRERVGGKWEQMGPLQLEFLISQGLEPRHRLLDVGCGPLRAGMHFVDYLDPGGYYGIDINETLLDAGYDHELPEPLRPKLPRDHLRATERFDCSFGVDFDYAIANSVFTHVSLNHVRLCLFRVAQVMPPGGRFFATFFEAPASHPLDLSRNGGSRWTERNAFFYYRADLEWAARCAPWTVSYVGQWGHPGGQRMMEFRRTRPKAGWRALRRRARRRVKRLRNKRW
jgi:SAM-dependent methyltransferase